MEFSFESQRKFSKKSGDDYETFTEWWSEAVAEKFDLDKDEILAIYDKKNDSLDTWQKAEELFWYGDGLEFTHLPALFINGELQAEFPKTGE